MNRMQQLIHEDDTRVSSICDSVFSDPLVDIGHKDVFSKKGDKFIDDLLSGKIILDQSEETSSANETMQGEEAPMPNLAEATISGAEPREPDDVDDESEIVF